MGKSFVLRDETGNIVGYIQRAGNVLRCGICSSEKLGDGYLYVCHADHTVKTQRLHPNQTEYIWSGWPEGVAGGAIIKDNQILADTGMDSRACIKKFLRCEKESKEKEDQKTHTYNQNEEADKSVAVRPFCVRWPPNPCCLKTSDSLN